MLREIVRRVTKFEGVTSSDVASRRWSTHSAFDGIRSFYGTRSSMAVARWGWTFSSLSGGKFEWKRWCPYRLPCSSHRPSFIFRSPLEAPHRSKSSDSTRVGTDLSTRRTDAHRQKAAKLEALAAPDYLGITKNFEW